jgi:2-beta-glucuronyltransferase
MKKILLLSGHLFESKRNANFHHIANACANNGNEVTFCTVPNSINTLITQKHNIKNRIMSYFYALYPKKVGNINVTSYISLAYPVNKIFNLNSLLLWFFNHGYSTILKEKYDVVIIENGIPLLLFDKLKQLNTNAKFTYRVSDPVKKDMGWPEFLELENRIIDKFDLISTPASLITKKLLKQYPSCNIQTHYHGIDIDYFTQDFNNPYEKYSNLQKHFIFVGASKLDELFINIASNISENYIFHVIGPFEENIKKDNVIYYGEIRYEETIKYIKNADICLQTLIKFPYCEIYERTLKYTQYSFFKKAILAPYYMKLKDKNVFNYDTTEESINFAISKALASNLETLDNSWIKTWNEIAIELCE